MFRNPVIPSEATYRKVRSEARNLALNNERTTGLLAVRRLTDSSERHPKRAFQQPVRNRPR
jgi:hypothetical protein